MISPSKAMIVNAIQQNIKVVRRQLEVGLHDPEIMERIELLQQIKDDLELFEIKLYLDNMDID
jgi:hypothetical protein